MALQYESNGFLKPLFHFFESNENKDKEESFLKKENEQNYNRKDSEEKNVTTRTLNFMFASTIILCVLHPLDTIRTRKQIYRVYRNTYPYFYNNQYSLFYILRKEKIESLYRGLLASLVTTAISHGLFRYIYDTSNYFLVERTKRLHETKISNNKESKEERKETNIQEYSKRGKKISDFENKYASKEQRIPNEHNVNYYILTSTVSSLISIIFIHPLWLIKTKIESTINLNYKFENYKSRLLSKHYHMQWKSSSPYHRHKLKNVFQIFGTFRCKNQSKVNIRSRIQKENAKTMTQYNPKLFHFYKHNFVGNKCAIANTTKYNLLLFKEEYSIFQPKEIRRKILHNYILYEYFMIPKLERKMFTKKKIKQMKRQFCARFIQYTKSGMTNHHIFYIFKREKKKQVLSTVYRYNNYPQFVYEIYKKEKFASFYRGFLASILLTPHVTIQFCTYEYLTYYFNSDYVKNILSQYFFKVSKKSLDNFLPFLFGVLSKCAAIVCTYPLHTIKIRQQVQLKNYGFLYVLINIFKQEGFKAYFTGINMHLLRSCLQNGILFYIFEYLNNLKRIE